MSRAAGHPAAQSLQRAATAAWGLVRPVSHTLVAHRLLRLLVPLGWLRTLAEVLLVPLLVDPSLRGITSAGARTSARPTVVK